MSSHGIAFFACEIVGLLVLRGRQSENVWRKMKKV